MFSDAAAWWRPEINLAEPGTDPIRVRTIETSANLFSLLGVSTQRGSGFPAGGPFFSRDRIAVISDRLGRDPVIIREPAAVHQVDTLVPADHLAHVIGQQHRASIAATGPNVSSFANSESAGTSVSSVAWKHEPTASPPASSSW